MAWMMSLPATGLKSVPLRGIVQTGADPQLSGSKRPSVLLKNQSTCRFTHRVMGGMLGCIRWYLQERWPTSGIARGKVVRVYGNLGALGNQINLRKVLAIIADIADRDCASK